MDLNVLEIYLEKICVHFRLRLSTLINSTADKVGTVETVKVFNYETVEAEDVADSGASNVKVRWLITKDMGAPNFAMRLFEVAAGGCSPLHTHPWEHEVFILEGEGVISDGKKATPLKPNYVVYVAPDEWHQFKNTSKQTLKFLCLIPHPRQKPREPC